MGQIGREEGIVVCVNRFRHVSCSLNGQVIEVWIFGRLVTLAQEQPEGPLKRSDEGLPLTPLTETANDQYVSRKV